jgi:hypothetical protein
MGQGICGVIQLNFEMRGFSFEKEREYFSPNYFDFYDRKTKGSDYLFTIKPELFLPHYGDFLVEFNETIGETFELEGELLNINDFEQFEKNFSRSGTPRIWGNHYISIMSCETHSAWQFYSGSYKAYLEEYSTLTHFERVLSRAMKNPLTPIIKLGILG